MRVNYAEELYDEAEIEAVKEVLKDESSFLAPGKRVREFEGRIASLFGKKYGIMVNSGSSANFLVLYAIQAKGKGIEIAEVLTPALTFSTTLAPIIQTGMTPVLFDVDPRTFQIDIDALEEYIMNNDPSKSRILMIPALIGNLPDLQRLEILAEETNTILLLDSCDTNGAYFAGRPIGTYAEFVTTSFYGSHIITAAGAGGMIMTDVEELRNMFYSLRGWGRRSATTGESENIEERFNHTIDGIPYDSKFIFEHLGFNMQVTEMQAAFALCQISRLEDFIRARKQHFQTLLDYFKDKRWFITPEVHPKADSPWMNFPLTLSENCPFERNDITRFLEENNIQTRPVFTGNVTRQPAFRGIVEDPSQFKNADYIMRNSFMLGCHQGLQETHLHYVFETFDRFLERYDS